MFILPWYEFDAVVSSREKKRRADVYSRNIRPDIFCAAPPTGMASATARCRRTNDLMREGLETPDSSSQPGNERGKKGHAWRQKVREGRRKYGLCEDRAWTLWCSEIPMKLRIRRGGGLFGIRSSFSLYIYVYIFQLLRHRDNIMRDD